MHDLNYKHANDDYMKNPTSVNKKLQMQKVWDADDKFINAMNEDNEEPMAPIAGKLIELKKTAEQLGAPTTFSGFGATDNEKIKKADPIFKLKQLLQEHYKTEERKERKQKIQKGGIGPLLAIGLPVLGALASEIVKDIYGVVKKKMFGGKLKHKSLKTQKFFLKYFVNSI